MKDRVIKKALFIPVNSYGQILIQDRRGFKKPDWGFFGGSIEEGETPISALLREVKEELNINLKENDVIFLGTSLTSWNDDVEHVRHLYLYNTDQKEFADHEGRGAFWMSFEEASQKLEIQDKFNEVKKKLEKFIKLDNLT